MYLLLFFLYVLNINLFFKIINFLILNFGLFIYYIQIPLMNYLNRIFNNGVTFQLLIYNTTNELLTDSDEDVLSTDSDNELLTDSDEDVLSTDSDNTKLKNLNIQSDNSNDADDENSKNSSLEDFNDNNKQINQISLNSEDTEDEDLVLEYESDFVNGMPIMDESIENFFITKKYNNI